MTREVRAALGPVLATAAALAAVAVVGVPRAGRGYADGPPAAHTGGFGEPTCRACHFDNALNDPSGELRLEGVPTRYVPGRAYRIDIALTRPGLELGGFQLSARFAGERLDGRQAGRIRPDDDGRVEVARAERTGVAYAQHTEAGTHPPAPDTARWTVVWTAPDAAGGGDVVFHAAANAANGDVSEFGDFVFTARRTAEAPGERR